VHDGSTLNCFGTAWKCEHRLRSLGNMVALRRAADAAAVSNWWDNGNNQIAFARTGRAFVVINREGAALTRAFTTGLPAGTYCNVIEGDFAAGTCSGPTVAVGSTGQATLTVPAMRAAAIHVNARF
jgi:alpha-amylase